jgi:hypothetical protein
VKYDSASAAAFYDECGERERTRFEDGRTRSVSPATHADDLRRFVSAGDRVLDAGCGPGRVMSLVGTTARAIETVLIEARTEPDEPELRAMLEQLELDLGAEPGAIQSGPHILAVVPV